MSGGLDWSQVAVRQTHAVGAGELPGPFAALGQRGRSVSQQTHAPDLWASVRDNPPLAQVRSGGLPASMEVEPWGCGGGCGSKGSAAPSRPSRPTRQDAAEAVPWIFAGLGQGGQKSAAKAEPYDLWAPLRQGGQSNAEGCGCQDQAPRKQARQQTGGPTVKIVSGDWLAEVMRLDAETAQRIAGQEVHLDAEAWGAVRAVTRVRTTHRLARLRIERLRQKIWPDQGKLPDGPAGAGGAPDGMPNWWAPESTYDGADVIHWGGAPGTTYRTVAEASSEWGIEENGVQATDLAQLDLNCYFLLHGTLLWRGLEGDDGSALEVNIESLSASDIERLDYGMGDSSICRLTSVLRAGTPDVPYIHTLTLGLRGGTPSLDPGSQIPESLR